MLTKTVTKSR